VTGWIDVCGISFSRLWHCFGTEHHRCDLDTACALLTASGTNVLPINTHRLDGSRQRGALEHGFAGVEYDDLATRVDMSKYVKMLNINLRTSAEEAVRTAKAAVDMTGERILKLEVLAPGLRDSQDDEVVLAATRLLAWDPGLIVLPLLSTDINAAKQAIDAGCPLLRVMGSLIGSREGIVDRDAFEQICSMSVPVVLDGGIGAPQHISQAAECGAQGVLVNSVLFDTGPDPAAVMRQMRQAADNAFNLP